MFLEILLETQKEVGSLIRDKTVENSQRVGRFVLMVRGCACSGSLMIDEVVVMTKVRYG